MSADERDLLTIAAKQARSSLSDFVRRRALEAAEIDIVSYPVVTIPAADWKKFETWVNSPAKDVPALRALSSHRPAWQD